MCDHSWQWTSFSSLEEHNVMRSKAQQTRGLKIHLTDGVVTIPIKDRCLYLGTVMSYDNFEMQFLKLRLAVGWSQFRRLQRWLCGRKKVHVKLRLQIMNTCILPCVCYGILFTGITLTGLQQQSCWKFGTCSWPDKSSLLWLPSHP